MISLSVCTSEGALEGAVDASSGAFLWLGIPYAEPPVGKLRFRAPVPKAPWEGVRKDDVFGPVSVQRAKDGSVIGSEDCLYLNVYRPAVEEEDLPVFFFLHGTFNVQTPVNKPTVRCRKRPFVRYDRNQMILKQCAPVDAFLLLMCISFQHRVMDAPTSPFRPLQGFFYRLYL